MRYLFDKIWFAKYQYILLFLLNAPIIKYWFRWVLRIHKDCSFKEKIVEIQPNNYNICLGMFLGKDGLYYKYRRDFRTHNKFSKRLFHAFYPLWWMFHQWDMLIANTFKPAWNLGFDTLTVYPDANPETTTVDGDVGQNGVDQTLADIRANTGNEANSSAGNANGYTLFASATSNQYQRLYRWIFLYDTSALTANATVSAAVHSTYVGANGKVDNLSGQSHANSVMVLVASTPASNTDLVSGDYAQTGSTDFGRSAKQDSISTVAYNDITLNASGIAAISKTGVTKFALRVGWDFDNTTTGLTWSSGGKQGYDIVFADTALTTTDPKLVITYTAGQIINVADTISFTETKLLNLQTIKADVISFAETVKGNLDTTVRDTISFVESKLLNMVISVADYIGLTDIAEALTKWANLVLKHSTTMVNGAKNAVSSMINGVKNLGTFVNRGKS